MKRNHIGEDIMLNSKYHAIGLCAFFSLTAMQADSANITWNGLGPQNDLNTAGNWTPPNVPTSSDNAIFDNRIPNIDLTPSASLTNFSASEFNFPHAAQPFSFTFNECSLELSGTGITGSNTNTIISATNINNSTPLVQSQIILDSAGRAAITANNSGTVTGSVSGVQISEINTGQSQISTNGTFPYDNFSMLNGGSLTVSNIGVDNSSGTGNNAIGYVGNSQIQTRSFNAQNNASITAHNMGTNTITTPSSGGSNIGLISNHQISCTDSFTAGNDLQITLTNTAIDNSLSLGQNNVGSTFSHQFELDGTFAAGNNAAIFISNSGTGNNPGSQTNIGVVVGTQLFSSGNFQTGNSLFLSITNSGESSAGSNAVGVAAAGQFIAGGSFTTGNNVIIAVANSGTDSSSDGTFCSTGVSQTQFLSTGPFLAGDALNFTATNLGSNNGTNSFNNSIGQILATCQAEFDSTFTVGDNTIINVSNNGTNTNDDFHNFVGVVDNDQFFVGGNLQGGNSFTLTTSNAGEDTGGGSGSDQIGYIGNTQIALNNVSVGDAATFRVNNSGINSNTSNGGNNSNIGYINNPQLSSLTFQAGDSLYLGAMNTGVDNTSNGSNFNNVGYVNDNQIELDAAFSSGKITNVVISNSGKSSGVCYNSNIGYVSGNQLASQSFQTEDSLVLQVSNSGECDGNSNGFNSIGYLYGQIGTHGIFTTGNNSTINISNSGACSNPAGNNLVGYSNGQQYLVTGAFSAGNFFTLTTINSGEDNSTGSGGNQAGVINSNQVEFDSSFIVGNNALINISNNGTNSNTGVNSSQTGFVNGSQLSISGPFSAGTNLDIIVTNDSVNTGNITSQVGSVVNSQIFFGDSCTLNDGAFISAVNNNGGSVGGPQMFFQNGFNLTGKATFQAINQGSVGQGQGISIAAGSGGDVNVILQNSQLFIPSLESTFTIGALNGDSTSSVQSGPQLIIDTDSGVNAVFAGDIQNFGQGISSLVKSGPGTQTLSGINTFTDSTAVNEGILILNGSLAGDLSITSLGTLKGTGSVGGNVANTGIISPGQSIGTLAFLGNFTNNGGGYNVEVNAAGQSDLIDVTGTASINGGLVTVSSSDGTYKFQSKYTIVEAGTVTGTYSGATAVSALIASTLTYDLQHVYLTLLTEIAKGATTANQLAVATQLDAIVNPNPQQSLLLNQLVNLPPSRVGGALDSLSGYQHTSDLFTAEAINRQFIRRLYDPIRSIVTSEPCACNPCAIECSNDFTPWLESGAVFTHLQGNDNVQGFNTKGYEITAGIQKTFCRNWTLGIAGSYEHDNLHYRGGAGSGNSNTWLGGIYGLYRPSCFYGLVDLTYGYSKNSLHRKIEVGNLHYRAHSKPKISQYTFYGEAGFDVSICDFLLQPFVGLETGSYRRKHIHETHADGWQLDVKKRDRSLSESRLGFHLTTCRSNVDMSLDFAWNRRLTQRKNKIRERFAEFGSTFEIEGIKLSKNSLDYALTASTYICEDLRAYIEGSGESWSHSHLYNLLAGIEFRW